MNTPLVQEGYPYNVDYIGWAVSMGGTWLLCALIPLFMVEFWAAKNQIYTEMVLGFEVPVGVMTDWTWYGWKAMGYGSLAIFMAMFVMWGLSFIANESILSAYAYVQAGGIIASWGLMAFILTAFIVGAVWNVLIIDTNRLAYDIAYACIYAAMISGAEAGAMFGFWPQAQMFYNADLSEGDPEWGI